MEGEVKVPKFETAAVAAIIVNLQTHKFLLCFGEREEKRKNEKASEPNDRQATISLNYLLLWLVPPPSFSSSSFRSNWTEEDNVWEERHPVLRIWSWKVSSSSFSSFSLFSNLTTDSFFFNSSNSSSAHWSFVIRRRCPLRLGDNSCSSIRRWRRRRRRRSLTLVMPFYY